MQRLITTLVTLTLCTSGLRGQSDSVPAAAVDAVFRGWSDSEAPGGAVAVLRDGEVVYSRGYGCAQLEYGVPIESETVFHVASVSKQFTAAAVCLLAEQGVLSLDDPIQRWVPEVPDFGAVITLRHLLTHTSGLRDQWEMLSLAGVRADDVITTRDILTMVARMRELNFTPGTRHLYCNTGFTLLAEAVSQASGVPFPEYCRRHIFAPLGMRNTHFHDDHQHLVPGRAYSYSRSPEGILQKEVLSFSNVGATSLFATADDLVLWMWGLIAGSVGHGGLAAEMLQPGTLADGSALPYGLGLALGRHRGFETFGHGGADAGFRSHVLFFPELGLGFAVVSNLAESRPDLLVLQVADLYLGYAGSNEGEPAGADLSVAPASDTAAPEEEPVVQLEPLDPQAWEATRVALEGFFDLGVGVLEVRRAGDGLVAGLLGEPGGRLEALSGTRFRSGPWTLEFTREGEQPASAVTATRGETAFQGQRLLAPELDLAPYLGRYFSEEAGTYYDLVDRAGSLMARHSRAAPVLLIPTEADVFRGSGGPFGVVRMERSEGGEVTGLRISGGRVLNLWFERREPSLR